MKQIVKIGLMVLSLIAISSCDLDGLNRQEVSGVLISEVSGKGIANTSLTATVLSASGYGIFSSSNQVSRKEITTNHQGEFSLSVKYEDRDNWVWFTKNDEEKSTDILNIVPRFYISELDEGPATLYVREFHPLEITVKNVDPFDSEDAIYVSVFFTVQENDNDINFRYTHSVIYDIVNRLDENLPHTYPVTDNGLRPDWIGDQVDSTIYGRLQEATTYKVIWSVRKNGVVTEYSTDFIPTDADAVNRVQIMY